MVSASRKVHRGRFLPCITLGRRRPQPIQERGPGARDKCWYWHSCGDFSTGLRGVKGHLDKAQPPCYYEKEQRRLEVRGHGKKQHIETRGTPTTISRPRTPPGNTDYRHALAEYQPCALTARDDPKSEIQNRKSKNSCGGRLLRGQVHACEQAQVHRIRCARLLAGALLCASPVAAIKAGCAIYLDASIHTIRRRRRTKVAARNTGRRAPPTRARTPELRSICLYRWSRT